MRDGVLDLRIVELRGLAQRGGKVKRADVNAVDAGHADDLLQMLQTLHRFALRQQHRLAVGDFKIVLQPVLGIILEPEAAARGVCNAALAERQIFAVFHDLFHLGHGAHIRDHKPHHAHVQQLQNRSAGNFLHARKRRQAVELRRAHELQRALRVERTVLRVDDDVIQPGKAEALRHSGAAGFKKCAERRFSGEQFFPNHVFH